MTNKLWLAVIAVLTTLVFVTISQGHSAPADPKPVVMPRYSVHLANGGTYIVDNVDEKMYVYLNLLDGGELKYVTDLKQVGKKKLVGVQVD